MTPPKAIIVVLTLFLMVAAGFVFLYSNRQKTLLQADLKKQEETTAAAGQKLASPKPAETIERQVKKIIEQAGQNQAASDPNQVRQEIIDAINSEIIKQTASKTVEPSPADLERQKALDQINSQIKQGLTN